MLSTHNIGVSNPQCIRRNQTRRGAPGKDCQQAQSRGGAFQSDCCPVPSRLVCRCVLLIRNATAQSAPRSFEPAHRNEEHHHHRSVQKSTVTKLVSSRVGSVGGARASASRNIWYSRSGRRRAADVGGRDTHRERSRASLDRDLLQMHQPHQGAGPVSGVKVGAAWNEDPGPAARSSAEVGAHSLFSSCSCLWPCYRVLCMYVYVVMWVRPVLFVCTACEGCGGSG